MTPVERLRDAAHGVPVEGLTWNKLMAGCAAFMALLVATGTLFGMVVIPVITSQAAKEARVIVAESMAAHSSYPHTNAVPRGEYNNHIEEASRQFAETKAALDGLRQDVKLLLMEVRK